MGASQFRGAPISIYAGHSDLVTGGDRLVYGFWLYFKMGMGLF